MAKYKASKVKEYIPSYRNYMVNYKKSRRKARFQNFLFRVFHIRPNIRAAEAKEINISAAVHLMITMLTSIV